MERGTQSGFHIKLKPVKKNQTPFLSASRSLIPCDVCLGALVLSSSSVLVIVLPMTHEHYIFITFVTNFLIIVAFVQYLSERRCRILCVL